MKKEHKLLVDNLIVERKLKPESIERISIIIHEKGNTRFLSRETYKDFNIDTYGSEYVEEPILTFKFKGEAVEPIRYADYIPPHTIIDRDVYKASIGE